MSIGDQLPTQSNSDLAGIINLITGKSGTTSSSKAGSSTTSANISPEGIKEMINQILAGPSGLSSIANAEHSAGLYGGSTETLLQNNLITQTAAKLAAAQAGTTTTTSDSVRGRTDSNPQINPLKALGGLAGLQFLSGTGAVGGLADLLKSGGSGLADLLKGLVGGNSGGVSGPLTPTDSSNPAGTSLGTFTGISGSGPGQSAPGDGLPPVDDYRDLSKLTTIPISALFPESGASDPYNNYGTQPQEPLVPTDSTTPEEPPPP